MRCMGKLIYSMFTSLDGYIRRTSPVALAGALLKTRTYIRTSTCLRRRSTPTSMGEGCTRDGLLEDRAHDPDQPQFVLDWAQQWRAAEKIVYSRILAEPHSAHLDAVRRLKDDAEHDISVDGPEVAALCCGPSEIKESRQESLTETNQLVASLFE